MSSIIKPPLGTVLNPLHPLSQGLVGYWLMNEGAGSLAQDISGKGNHGRLTNMAPNVQGSGWGGSKFGGGLQFDGANDYVDVGDLDAANEITLSAIVKFDDVVWGTDPDGNTIIEKGYDGTKLAYRLSGSDGDLWLGFYNGDWNNKITYPQSNFSTNTQYHLTGTISSSDIKLYVDGLLVANLGSTPDALSTASNDKNCLIGAYDKNGTIQNYHDGLIDEVRIYNRALSPAEIKQLYLDPYCNLMTRTPSGLYVPTGGLSIPVAMYHYNQLARA